MCLLVSPFQESAACLSFSPAASRACEFPRLRRHEAPEKALARGLPDRLAEETLWGAQTRSLKEHGERKRGLGGSDDLTSQDRPGSMLRRVDLRIGDRYLAVLPGEGEVEVTLLSPTTGTSFPEGGGEALYVAAWWVRAEDGRTFKVEEPGLKPQP